MTFPRVTVDTGPEVSPAVQARRDAFAAGPLARRVGAPAAATIHASPEAAAFAFGAMLQREFGNDWSRLIGIATQAAIRADHGVTE